MHCDDDGVLSSGRECVAGARASPVSTDASAALVPPLDDADGAGVDIGSPRDTYALRAG